MLNNHSIHAVPLAPWLGQARLNLLRAAAAIVVLLSAGNPALAADDVSRSHRIEVDAQTRLEVENNVGRIELRRHDEAYIQLDVTIEAGRRGMFRRKVDITHADISIEQRDTHIRLALKEDNVSGHWVIYIPDFDEVRIQNGVGQVKAEWLNSNTDIQVGVGDVTVVVDSEQLGEFSADVGVGSIRAEGIEQYSSNRRVVTESSSGRGRGDKRLQVEVGVGDIAVKAERAR